MLRTFLGLKPKKLRTSQGFKNFRRSYKKKFVYSFQTQCKRKIIVENWRSADTSNEIVHDHGIKQIKVKKF